MANLHFQLVTPEGLVLEKDLKSLTCPTTLGEISILPGHVPIVATLKSGELIAKTDSGAESLHVAGGFIEVKPGGQVIALADSAEHATEIDEARAEEAKVRAQKTLAEIRVSDEEYARAAASLERSLSRLRIVRKHAHSRTAPITGEGVFKE